MSQHAYNIPDQQGAPFLADVNNVLAAIKSTNSGGTEPASTTAFMLWADTAADMLRIRNAANNGWVEAARLSTFGLPSVQKQTATRFTTTGTSTAYLLTPLPAITANTAGLRFRAVFHTAAGATPTLAVSGQTALPLKYKDAAGVKQAVTATQIPANWSGDVECDGTDWVLLNTPPASTGAGSGFDADTLDGIHASGFVKVDHGHNAIGSPAAVRYTGATAIAPGGTVAGSVLHAAGIMADASGAAIQIHSTLAGTWRCLGYLYTSNGAVPVLSFAQRIA